MDSNMFDGLEGAVLTLIIVCVIIGIGAWELLKLLFSYIDISMGWK